MHNLQDNFSGSPHFEAALYCIPSLHKTWEVLVVGKRFSPFLEVKIIFQKPIHFSTSVLVWRCCMLFVLFCTALQFFQISKKHTHPPKPLFWVTVPPTSRNPRETCLKAYMLLPPGKMTPSIRLRCFTARPQSFCFKTFRFCLDVPLEVRING